MILNEAGYNRPSRATAVRVNSCVLAHVDGGKVAAYTQVWIANAFDGCDGSNSFTNVTKASIARYQHATRVHEVPESSSATVI